MNSQVWYNALSYLSACSILIPLFSCIYLFSALNRTLKILLIYCLISAIADIIGFFLSYSKIQIYFNQHIFTIIECTLICLIFFSEFESQVVKRIIAVSYAIFMVISLWVMFYLNKLNHQDNIISSTESVLIMGLSSIYFYTLTNELSIEKLDNYYFFWVNSAFLVYFSMAFFLYLMNT